MLSLILLNRNEKDKPYKPQKPNQVKPAMGVEINQTMKSYETKKPKPPVFS
jgi:hypothetical protein